MKRFLFMIVTILFPWLIFILEDHPVMAFFALGLQATLIGWIPAAMWAWRVVKDNEFAKKQKTRQQQPKPNKPSSSLQDKHD